MEEPQLLFPIPEVRFPPREFRDGDEAIYVRTARYNMRVLSQHVPLRPHMKVVEIGCAAGRLALPLLEFLDPAQGGGYLGFDILKPRIEWAQANISHIWPHFRFDWIDVYNSHFNPSGRTSANGATFPVVNEYADLVLAHSVALYLLESATRRYLKEIRRVLKPGGYAYITAFLWNEDAKQAVDDGTSGCNFPHVEGNVRLQNNDVPEQLVAVEEDFFKAQVAEKGMKIVFTQYGKWREGFPSGQDFVILQRE